MSHWVLGLCPNYCNIVLQINDLAILLLQQGTCCCNKEQDSADSAAVTIFSQILPTWSGCCSQADSRQLRPAARKNVEQSLEVSTSWSFRPFCNLWKKMCIFVSCFFGKFQGPRTWMAQLRKVPQTLRFAPSTRAAKVMENRSVKTHAGHIKTHVLHCPTHIRTSGHAHCHWLDRLHDLHVFLGSRKKIRSVHAVRISVVLVYVLWRCQASKSSF